MNGEYAFGVQIHLEPQSPAVRLEPAVVETRCLLTAPTPGEEGWLFFRDHCWRGEIRDERPVRELLEEHLGHTVVGVELRGLHVDEAYREALEAEIAADLNAFRADSIGEVVSKYLGSRLEVEH